MEYLKDLKLAPLKYVGSVKRQPVEETCFQKVDIPLEEIPTDVVDLAIPAAAPDQSGSRSSILDALGDLVFSSDEGEPDSEMSSVDNMDFSLHQAASEGATDVLRQKVEEMMRLNVIVSDELNKLNSNGFSPLHLAAQYNRKNVISFLVKNGADVNIKTNDEQQVTPLHVAIMYRRIAAAKCIVDAGGDPTLCDAYGSTALHLAARYGAHTIVAELLKRGVDPNAKDNALTTPLHSAAISGSEAVTKLLIDHGADVSATDNEGETCIHFVAQENHHQLIKLLVEGVIRNVPDDQKQAKIYAFVNNSTNERDTALHLAAQTGYMETVKTLIDYNADVNLKTDTGSAPLHLAATGGHLDIVKYLILRGAKSTATDGDLQHPLHQACQFGHIDVIKLLHEHNAKLDVKDKDHFTPLMCAVWKGQIEAVRYLLDNGAKIVLRDINGKSLIHLAIEEDQNETLELIINHQGADKLVNLPDNNFKTPLHYAALKGNNDAIKLLLSKNAEVDVSDQEERTPLHIAAENGNLECVKFLGEHSPGITNASDDRGRSAMHLAAMNGHREVVLCLIEIGGEISCRDDVNWTPLDYTARNGFFKTMAILLENDASVDATDKNKTTPLHLASENNHIECINMLLDAGASISLCNKDSKNCLDLAIETFNNDTCMAFLEHKRWREALRYVDADGATFMEKLIRVAPEAAEFVLDKCIETSDHPVKHDDYCVRYNFEYLDLPPSLHSTYFGPSSMVAHKRYNLLSHPVTVRLVLDKWNRLGEWLYLPLLLLYLIFVALLTTLIIVDKERSRCRREQQANRTRGIRSTSSTMAKCTSFTEQSIIPWFLLIVSLMHLVKESVQLFYLGKKYFKEFVNYLEILLYTASLVFVVPFVIQSIDKDLIQSSEDAMSAERKEQYRYLEAIKWNSGALAVLVAWCNLLLFLKRFPSIGLHVVMFVEVTKTLLRVLLVFCFLILAFSLSFYILLDDQDAFRYPGRSILKTFVMTIGEFEYSSIFVDNYYEASKAVQSSTEPYRIVTFFIFIGFLVLMPILFMNLLVGLAVGDIEAVRNSAFILILKNQVELLKTLENTLPKNILQKAYRTVVVDYPNQSTLFQRIKDIFQSLNHNVGKKSMDDSNQEEVVVMLQKNRVELDKQKKHLKNICEMLEKQYEISEAILKHYAKSYIHEDSESCS